MARTVQAPHPSTVALCNSFGQSGLYSYCINITGLTSKLVLEHISKALADSGSILGFKITIINTM